MEQRMLEDQTLERLLAARADWTEVGNDAAEEIRQLKRWIQAWWLTDEPVDTLLDLEMDLWEAQQEELVAATWCDRIDTWILEGRLI